MKIQKKLHYVFSVDKMAADFRSVGYPEESVQETIRRWEKHDGRVVHFDIDSDNGFIRGTQIGVNRKWCNNE